MERMFVRIVGDFQRQELIKCIYIYIYIYIYISKCVCVRDEKLVFICAQTMWKTGKPTPQEAEVWLLNLDFL